MLNRINGREINNNIHLSLIISTMKEAPTREYNSNIIHSAFLRLKSDLRKILTDELNTSYLNEVSNNIEKIDYKKITHGIGIYVSGKTSELIYFDIPVANKLVVNTFQVKEILLREQSFLRSYIVLLNDDHIRLLSLNGEKIKEITDGTFPFQIKNEFQFPETKNVLSRVPEESVIKMKRIVSKLREAEKTLDEYITQKNIPIIFCGLNKILSAFKKINKSFHQAAYFELNLDKYSLNEIAKFVYPLIKKIHEAEILNMIKKIDNKSNKELFIKDIIDIWYASKEKKGDKLFVETSFAKPAVLDSTSGELFIENLDSFTDGNYVHIQDLVNNIIENVVFSGGKVYFLPDNTLTKYNRIAMSLRYN